MVIAPGRLLHPVGDLPDLQVRVHLRADALELPPPFEGLQEGAQIVVGHGDQYVSDPGRPLYRSRREGFAVTVETYMTHGFPGGSALLRFVVQWLVPIALAIFAWVDCLLTPRPWVRFLPKPVWVVLIAMPYLGALLWIFSGRTTQPRVAGRRATDTSPGLFTALGRGGAHQARPRIVDTPASGGRGGGAAPSTWTVAPDDDPEFLRRLGEQLKKDRPEN